MTSLYKLGDVAACRRVSCVLCAVQSETCRSDIIVYEGCSIIYLPKQERRQ